MLPALRGWRGRDRGSWQLFFEFCEGWREVLSFAESPRFPVSSRWHSAESTARSKAQYFNLKDSIPSLPHSFHFGLMYQFHGAGLVGVGHAQQLHGVFGSVKEKNIKPKDFHRGDFDRLRQHWTARTNAQCAAHTIHGAARIHWYVSSIEDAVGVLAEYHMLGSADVGLLVWTATKLSFDSLLV